MANKGIIERIKKLLALSKGNTNTAEATAAALKAQKLIAEYDVSKFDLYGEEADEITEVESSNVRGNPWARRLAHVIANNFRCRIYINVTNAGYDFWTGKKDVTEGIVFMGYETDAEAARVTFDRLFEIGNKLAGAEVRRIRNLYGTASGVKNSYLMGYVKGIEDELEKQCVALVLVRPKAVDDYADERTAGFTTSRRTVRGARRGASFDSGRTAGRDNVRSARLSGQKALNA